MEYTLSEPLLSSPATPGIIVDDVSHSEEQLVESLIDVVI